MLLNYDPNNINKNHNWKRLYIGPPDDGLLQFEYLLCSNCNMSAICRDSLCYGYNHIFPDYNFNCTDFLIFVQNSITHDWILNIPVIINMKKEVIIDYKCKICELTGIKISYTDTPWIIPSQTYTCNEWLMIKANE